MGELEGLSKMLGTMHLQVDAIREATPGLVVDGAEAIRGAAVALLSLTSHPPGTLTPSAPGMPPAQISGDLARSVVVGDPAGDGDTWTIDIGPTIVYARIQELGGVTGKDYRTTLPPRPYMLPTVEAFGGQIAEEFADAWSAAIRIS